MQISPHIRRTGFAFAILAGLLILGSLVSLHIANAAPNDRSTIQERYDNHYCATNRERFADTDYCRNLNPEPEPEAPTMSLSAYPLSVLEGETTEITWTSENADSCTASDDWSGEKGTSGSEEVIITATSTYTLTCSGEGGEVGKSVTVAAVIEPEPEAPTMTFLADPLLVEVGQTTQLTWTSEYANTCTASDDWVGEKGASGSEEIIVNATSTYTLTCSGEGGEVGKSVTVAAYTLPETEEPTLDLYLDPEVVPLNSTTTIYWTANNVDTCEAFGDWSGVKPLSGSEGLFVATTSSYTMVCTADGVSISKSIGAAITDPDPEPTVDHILISEVLYDLGTGQGSEAGGANEWVELYNPTDSAVDLMNWVIGNGSSNDVISDTELLLEPGEYLVITNATTTADFWDFSEVDVVYLGSSISGGLANSGDVVKLYNTSATEIDAVSYDNNTDAFDPSVPGVSAGSSIERTDLDIDTDSAADWSENTTPTPGS